MGGDSLKKLLTGLPYILCPFRVCTHWEGPRGPPFQETPFEQWPIPVASVPQDKVERGPSGGARDLGPISKTSVSSGKFTSYI